MAVGADPPSRISPMQVKRALEALGRTMLRPDDLKWDLGQTAADAMCDIISDADKTAADTIMGVMVNASSMITPMGSQLMSAPTEPERSRAGRQLRHVCAILSQGVARVNHVSAAFRADAMRFLDTLVDQMLRVASTPSDAAQEAWLTVGSIAVVMEGDFARHLSETIRLLSVALGKLDDFELLFRSVTCLSNVAVASGTHMLPYASTVMGMIHTICVGEAVHRDVKPLAIGAIGDLAIGLQASFQPFAPGALSTLALAQKAAVSADADEDLQDWIQDLRRNILEAYSGIYDSFKHEPGQPDNRSSIREPARTGLRFVHTIVEELSRLSADDVENVPDDIIIDMTNVIADFARIFGPHEAAMTASPTMPWVVNLCTLADTRDPEDRPGTECLRFLGAAR